MQEMNSLQSPQLDEAPTVLFVDDERDIARVFVRITKDWGYEADAVCSSEDALKLASVLNYEVVVTDLLMPELNGVQLIEMLSRRLPNTTFVLVSGAVEGRDVPVELADRVVSVLPKPVNWDDLRSALERAVELSEFRRVSSTRPVVPTQTLVIESASTGSLSLRHALEIVDGSKPETMSRLDDALVRLYDTKFDTIVVERSAEQGWDAVRRLRLAAPEATLVVFGGPDDDDALFQALECGAQDYLTSVSSNSSELRRALSVARARRRAELQEMRASFSDGLTGLANRTAWEERVRQAASSSQRTGATPGVVSLDLGGFRNINDVYGRNVGDAVLREVAGRVAREVRDYELAARLGGDEFVVLATQVDPPGLQKLAQRLLSGLTPVVKVGSHEFQLTPRVALTLLGDGLRDPAEILRELARTRHRAHREGASGVHWAGVNETIQAH